MALEDTSICCNDNISNALNEEKSNHNACRKIGSKYEVFQGLALRTSGGLCKDDLMESKRGQIISKKRHEQGKKAFKNIENFIKSNKDANKIDQEEKLEENNNKLIEDLETPAIVEEVKSEEANVQDLKQENKAKDKLKKLSDLKIRKSKSKSNKI